MNNYIISIHPVFFVHSSQATERKLLAAPPKKKNIFEQLVEEGKAKMMEKQKYGFNCGFTVEKVVGVKKIVGRLHYVIKWKELATTELIDSVVAKHKCNQQVIEFYEKNITWY